MNVTRSTPIRTPDAAPSPKRRLHWLTLGMGMAAGALGVGVIAASPNAVLLGFGPDADESGTTLFGAPPQNDRPSQPLKILTGVSGETFALGAPNAVTAEADTATPGPSVAPVAWDRLSAGGCMTVTTKEGQTFSFSILGARPVATASTPAEAPPKIDLAVTPCSATGQPIAKAVIEPTPAIGKFTISLERAL